MAKAELIAEAYALSGVEAMLPARGDFSLGRDALQALAAKHRLPYVLSNVVCADPLPWPTALRFARGGSEVIVVGIASPDLAVPGCTVRDAGAVLASLPADDTVVIVLSDLPKGQDEALAAKAPAIDFLVRGNSMESLASPEALEGGGLLLASGSRGKLLGLLRVSPTAGGRGWRDAGAGAARTQEVADAQTKLAELAERKAAATDERSRERVARQEAFWEKKKLKAEAALASSTAPDAGAGSVENELRPLGTDIAEHPATFALVAAFKSQHSGTKSAPPSTGPSTQHEGTGFGTFVGNNACTGCHAKQAAQWATTGHARAWASLVAQERQYDPDCFACHVTGAKSSGGPTDPHQLGGLEDVGCESCHGAGRAHVTSPAEAHLVRSPPTSQCVGCHDSRQDGGRFEEVTYRARVKH